MPTGFQRSVCRSIVSAGAMTNSPPPPFTLRPATNLDQPAIWALISSVLRNYGITTDLASTDQDLADIEASFGQRGGCFFVLLDGPTVVGTVALNRESPSCCELGRMYLSPAYRRRGLGRMLLDKAITEAKAQGYAGIHLKTAAVLVEAIRLYESVGFVRTSDTPVSKNCDLAMTKRLG
jgi:putative acetyltransferase